MWLLLPDAGSTPGGPPLQWGKLSALLLTQDTWEDSQYLTVHLRMPKFDMASDLDLSQACKVWASPMYLTAMFPTLPPTTTQTEELFISAKPTMPPG